MQPVLTQCLKDEFEMPEASLLVILPVHKSILIKYDPKCKFTSEGKTKHHLGTG